MFVFVPVVKLYQSANFSASADVNKQNAKPITLISPISSVIITVNPG